MVDKFEKFLAFSFYVYKRNPMIFSKDFVFPCISTELIAADNIIPLFETPKVAQSVRIKIQFSSNLQRR